MQSRACQYCGDFDHSSKFCEQAKHGHPTYDTNKSFSPGYVNRNVDKRGRPVTTFAGQEICAVACLLGQIQIWDLNVEYKQRQDAKLLCESDVLVPKLLLDSNNKDKVLRIATSFVSAQPQMT